MAESFVSTFKRYCGAPAHLRRTSRIALVVGLVLTGINEGDIPSHPVMPPRRQA